MLLGLSGAKTDHDIRPTDLTKGAGVPHGELLVQLVDASFDSTDALAAARDACIETLGIDTTIDAAAVIANFHMMTRIADSTGTPLDDGTAQMTGDLRDSLGLNDFATKRFDQTA